LTPYLDKTDRERDSIERLSEKGGRGRRHDAKRSVINTVERRKVVGGLKLEEPLIGLVDIGVEVDRKTHGITLIGEALDN
jgi:hypothetical protein